MGNGAQITERHAISAYKLLWSKVAKPYTDIRALFGKKHKISNSNLINIKDVLEHELYESDPIYYDAALVTVSIFTHN